MSKSNKKKIQERKQEKGVFGIPLFILSIPFIPFIMIYLFFEKKLNISYKDKLKSLFKSQIEILKGDYKRK